jgi:hypothetical protein
MTLQSTYKVHSNCTDVTLRVRVILQQTNTHIKVQKYGNLTHCLFTQITKPQVYNQPSLVFPP